MTTLAFDTITETAERVATGDLSPVELTRHMLQRIEEQDGRFGSYVTVLADAALDEARTAEEEIAGGHYRGPLHGIPIAIKDLIFTEDFVGQAALDGVRAALASSVSPDSAEPVGRGSLAGRVEQRIGGSDGGGVVLWRVGYGYGRLDPLSGGGMWHCGAEADLWTGESGGRFSALWFVG